MSFRKYGGTNKLEKNNNITVHSIVADTFTIRDAFLSVFTIEGDLQIGGNGIISNNLTVSQQINATTLDISSNATIEGNLYLDKSNDVFFRGNNQMIGLNKSNPTATLDISSNKVQTLNLKTSAVNNRNIIARNFPNNGIAVVATGTTESGIQFYSANTGTIDASNAQGALIKYSNTDSLLSIDSTGDVKVVSKMIITDNTTNGNAHTDFGETVLIYDKDNGVNQTVFFNEAYGNTTVKTGSALTVQTINNASNTFMNITTPNRLGIQLGGGSYPKDPTRSMGVIDVYHQLIDVDATPAMMIVSGDSLTKYNSTTGFNTFQPKYNNYAVDINGPLHLNNGEVKKTIETTTRITELYNYGPNYGIAVGGQGTNNDGSYSYTPYTTANGGKSWTRKNPINSSDPNFTLPLNQTFNSVYSYNTTRTIIGGTGALTYVTDNAGVNWLQMLFTGINTINMIYTPLDISKEFVYIGGDAGGGNASIRYGYIEQYTDVYQLPGNPTVQRYRYINDGYTYPITGGIVSDGAGYGQNLFVVGGNKIYKFDLGVSMMTLTLTSTYTNPGSVTYSAIRLADANNGVAVGGNVISYTKNGGTTWTTANIPSLSGKTFNDVFLDGTLNAIVVGNDGYIYSSSDGYYTWKIVDEDVLNASGVGSRITDTTNNITSVFMPDSSTIILSIVKNNDSNANAAKLYYLNMPNIFNNKNNFLFDVSGCIRMSGDLVISEGGEIKSSNQTFNFVTTDVATLNAATNALAINMGGTNTTNISIGGANTTNLLAGGINTGSVIIGGDVTTSKIGPLNISSLTTGNVTLSNNLVTGNVYPSNAVISGNLQVTNGITALISTLNSISATSGALQIYGGMGIKKDLYTSGNINTSGNLFVSGNNIQMVSSDDVLFTNVTINSYSYVPDTGPLRIKGGAAISKNMYVGNDLRVEGNIILKGTVTSFSGLSQTTTIDAVLILTPFHGNSTQDVDYLSLAQGALTTDGGFGVGKNTWLRGNLRVDGINGVIINSSVESTSTNSGALRIIGGVGIGGNVYTGGNVIINNTSQSTSTVTGALQIRGGVGIGMNAHIGGNTIIYSNIESTSTNSGALRIIGGVGIGGNVYTGGNVIINNTSESTSTVTGALQIRGGVGIGMNAHIGGNTIIYSNIESTSTNSGALQIRGGVGIGGNVYTGGNVIINNTSESTSTVTGALQIRGGVGIGMNAHIGGNTIIYSNIESTSTNSGALRIIGGVGIGGNVYTGGNVIINNTSESTSTVTGALQIRGGVGIGMNAHIGGNTIIYSNIESTSTNSGALRIIGGVGIGGNVYTGGNVIINNTSESTSTVTGALQIRGGVGIGMNAHIGGNTIIYSNIESINTITGALQIAGGVGIGRNTIIGGNVIINSTIESTSTVTGALQIRGGVGIGGNVNIGGNANIGKTLIILDTTDSSSIVTGAFQVRGGMGVSNKIVSASLATGQISATNLSLTSDSVSENTYTGAFQVRGGIGVGGSINTGGNVIVNSIIESTSTNSGALQVRGGIGVNGNVHSKVVYTSSIYTTDINASGQMAFSSGNESSSAANGAVIISGGLGVAKNLNVGGNTIVYSIIESTSTNSGALQVRGGVGIGKNVYVGGSIYPTGDLTLGGQGIFNSTNDATTIGQGAIVTTGGIGVAKNAIIGGNVIVNSNIESTSTNSGALQVRGGIGIGKNLNVGGLISGSIRAIDNRSLNQAQQAGGSVGFGFGHFNNANSGGGYCDYIHFNSYGDNNGGLPNLLMLQKINGFGMRIFQPSSYGSASTYTNYRDVVLANQAGNVAITGTTTLQATTITGGLVVTSGTLIVSGVTNNITATGNNSNSFNVLTANGGGGSYNQMTAGSGSFNYITAAGGTNIIQGPTTLRDNVNGSAVTIENTNGLVVMTTAHSTSTITGALQVRGGVGIGGSLNVSGTLAVSGTSTSITGILGVAGGLLINQTETNSTVLPPIVYTANNVIAPYEIAAKTVSGGDGVLRLRAGFNGGVSINSHVSYIDLCAFKQAPAAADDRIIRFGTNSVERMRINVNGNVGIGTTAPVSAFQVVGTSTQGIINASGMVTASAGFQVVGTSTQGIINASGMVTASAGLTVNVGLTVDTSLFYTGTDIVFWNFTRGGNTARTGTLGTAMVHQVGNILVINYGGTSSFSGGVEVQGGISSTNTSTGSFRVVGGMAVSGNINVGGTLSVTGETVLGNVVKIGNNATSNTDTKSIFFGGLNSDEGYDKAVIESRLWGVADQTELLLYKGNDNDGGSNNVLDRIRLRSGQIVFDTIEADTARTLTNTKMLILSNGNVGIGTLAPVSLLNVNGTVTAPTFNAASDIRIKKDITDMNRESSLEIIRKVKPREYIIIDGESKDSVYGFIAQEVKEVIPKSTYLVTDFIPSVYENAFVDGNKITLISKTTTDISCCKFKLLNNNGSEVIVNVTKIHDNKTFSIDTDISNNVFSMDTYGNKLDKHTKNGTTKYMLGSQLYTGKVTQGIFVYGIQVDDFHTINKDTIFTVALSATQELDSQLQEARRTIRTLEERIAAIERRLS